MYFSFCSVLQFLHSIQSQERQGEFFSRSPAPLSKMRFLDCDHVVSRSQTIPPSQRSGETRLAPMSYSHLNL